MRDKNEGNCTGGKERTPVTTTLSKSWKVKAMMTKKKKKTSGVTYVL